MNMNSNSFIDSIELGIFNFRNNKVKYDIYLCSFMLINTNDCLFVTGMLSQAFSNH